VPARPFLDVLEVGLPQIEAGVEVAEGLGDRLDALPGDPRGGVEATCLVVVAGLHGVGEGDGAREQEVGLLGDIAAVLLGRGGLELGEVGVGRGGAVALGHREGAANPAAGHAGLAGRDVLAGSRAKHEVAGEAGSDVLDLARDRHAVLVQQVELGDLAAAVVDAKHQVAAGRVRSGERALRVGALDPDDAC
jgi:hypothetical protein